MRRQMTDRIGRARIAGDGEGLAAAAAEIDVTPLAALARLRQPVGAAERHERRRRLPDLGERMVADIPELQLRNAFRRMTGQHLAGRRDVERAPAPAADA